MFYFIQKKVLLKKVLQKGSEKKPQQICLISKENSDRNVKYELIMAGSTIKGTKKHRGESTVNLG